MLRVVADEAGRAELTMALDGMVRAGARLQAGKLVERCDQLAA